nr:MAG TPA: hypothetical protein [Caudoviricetes sp.]
MNYRRFFPFVFPNTNIQHIYIITKQNSKYFLSK